MRQIQLVAEFVQDDVLPQRLVENTLRPPEAAPLIEADGRAVICHDQQPQVLRPLPRASAAARRSSSFPIPCLGRAALTASRSR